MATISCRRATYVSALALFAVSFASAGDLYNSATAGGESVVLPKPADVQSLAVYPTKVALNGSDEAAQLVVTANLAGGRLQDLSGDVKYTVADSKVIRV